MNKILPSKDLHSAASRCFSAFLVKSTLEQLHAQPPAFDLSLVDESRAGAVAPAAEAAHMDSAPPIVDVMPALAELTPALDELIPTLSDFAPPQLSQLANVEPVLFDFFTDETPAAVVADVRVEPLDVTTEAPPEIEFTPPVQELAPPVQELAPPVLERSIAAAVPPAFEPAAISPAAQTLAPAAAPMPVRARTSAHWSFERMKEAFMCSPLEPVTQVQVMMHFMND